MAATLYAAKGGSATSNLYTINPATGGIDSTIGPIGYAITGLAFDPTDGTLYGSTSNSSPTDPDSIVTIDTSTGAGTLVGALGVGVFAPAADICFDSSGQMYGWIENGPDQLATIDKATGAGTLLGNSPFNTFGDAMDFDQSGTLWAFIAGGPKSVSGGSYGYVYTVNPSNGIATKQSFLTGGPNTSNDALAGGKFDSSGLFWGVLNDSTTRYLVTINVSTGAVTTVGTMTGSNWDALAWSVSVAPDFSVALSPSALTIAAGGTGSSSLTTTALLGDTESITLSASGQPAGVTVNFTSNPITAGGGSSVQVSVGGAVADGDYTLTIHATGTSNTHTKTLHLHVGVVTLILNPNRGVVGITVEIIGSGFHNSSAISTTFGGAPLTLSGGSTNGSGGFDLTFTVPNLPPGTYIVTVIDAGFTSASATFTICSPILYDDWDRGNTYAIGGPYDGWSGFGEWDIDVQQNPGEWSFGYITGVSTAYGTNSDNSMGCIYQGKHTFAWIEGELLTPLTSGVYVGQYDGITSTIIGGPIDGGSGSFNLDVPVLATDGTNLYLAYNKILGGSQWGYEVWKYDGGSWSHLYSYTATRVSSNTPNGGSARALGFSGVKLCASPNEPNAVYAGFKEVGPTTFLEISPGGGGLQSWRDRCAFTVTGLDSGAIVPGETVLYDDSVYLTGYPTDTAGTSVPTTWFGPRLEFQIVNDGGTPFVFWNYPGAGTTGWTDGNFHLLDLASLTDLQVFATDAGGAGYEVVGAYWGTDPANPGAPNSGSGLAGFPAICISQNLYPDPHFGNAKTWVVALKFGKLGTDIGEIQFLLVRTDGSDYHYLDGNNAEADQLIHWDINDLLWITNIWSERDNVWAFSYGDDHGGVPFPALWQYDRQCLDAWTSSTISDHLLPGFPIYFVLIGDYFRGIGGTQNLASVGLRTNFSYDTAWFHIHILRDADMCDICTSGLHIWQRF